MSGLNTPTIGAATLNDLIVDQAHMSKFEAFQADNIVGARFIKPVNRLKTLVDYMPFQSGNIIVDDGRSSLVATDAPTPKGDTEMAQMPVRCQEHRFAQSLSMAGKSLAEFWAEVQDLLRNRAGLRVKFDVEAQLMSILKNLGNSADFTAVTAEDISTAARKWNNYTGASHDPIDDIMDLQRRTGATRMFMGSDVAQALVRSPIITGSGAGSGSEFVTYDKLIQTLQGIGFSDVIIGHQPAQGRAIELPPQLKFIHDGVVAMWSPGTIEKYQFEAFQYDSYLDPDRRKEYYRALETCCFRVPYAEAVGVFTNVLQ